MKASFTARARGSSDRMGERVSSARGSVSKRRARDLPLHSEGSGWPFHGLEDPAGNALHPVDTLSRSQGQQCVRWAALDKQVTAVGF